MLSLALVGVVVLCAAASAQAAKPFKGFDRYCDPWNFTTDRDCRGRTIQPPPTEATGATGATGAVGGVEITPGDWVWPAPPGGRYARIRDGGRLAIAPRTAPRSVKRMIRAANSLTKKPYVWGGGHSRWYDRGYDCSGSVSFVLRAAGYAYWPMVSGQLAGWGFNGPGRWVNVYAHDGHVFMIIAGLRFDTSPWGDGVSGPRWRRTVRATGGFALRHPYAL
jgi:cell wall-associated NlpC family hydrolase